ncbi:MAG: hypothetical protein ACYTGG_11855, partial [Planctomycetota bacterium]
DGEPPTIWSWLYRLHPHVHLRIRLIRTVLAIMERERPTCVAILGDDQAFAWKRALIVRTIAAHHPQVPVDPVHALDRLRAIIQRGIRSPIAPLQRGSSRLAGVRRRVGRMIVVPGATIAYTGIDAAIRTRDATLQLARAARDGARHAAVAGEATIRFVAKRVEGWVIRAEQRLRIDRRGLLRGRVPVKTTERLAPGHLRVLRFCPPRYLPLRQARRPVQSGAAAFRYDKSERALHVSTSGTDYAIRWPRASRWRLKTSVMLTVRDVQAVGAHVLVTIDNGRNVDALRIDGSGLRLRSSGLLVPLSGNETTIGFNLYRSRTTVTVDGVECLRTRAGVSTGDEAGISLALRLAAPEDSLSMWLSQARLVYHVKPQSWHWPRRRPGRRARRPRRVRGSVALPATESAAAPLARVAAEEQLAALEARTSRFASGEFVGHALILLSGRSGSKWFYSRRRDHWFLWDEYIEYVPDALLEHCRRHHWRLTVLYLGEPPVFSDERRSYTERCPEFVDELSTLELRDVLAERQRDPPPGHDEHVDRLLADPAFAAAFSYRGVQFFDQVCELVGHSVRTLGLNFISQVHGWRQAIAQLQPDVVFGGRLEFKQAINLAAHELGARTVTVKLGVSEEMLPSVIAVRPDGMYDAPFFPDLFLVWGSMQQEYLRSRLPELESAIGVSGRTRSDSFINEAQDLDTEDIRRRLDFGPDDLVVIFGATCRTRYGQTPGERWGACCMSPARYRTCLAALLELEDRFPTLRVMVKPHPADDLEMIRGMIHELGSPRLSLVTRDMGFHNSELLAVSKLFVSSVSSMFAEAVISGRVAVNIWTPDVNYLYEQARTELYGAISETVRDVESLRETVTRLLADASCYEQALSRARLGLPRLFGEMDGQNARRAVEQGLALATDGPDVIVTPAGRQPGSFQPTRSHRADS